MKICTCIWSTKKKAENETVKCKKSNIFKYYRWGFRTTYKINHKVQSSMNHSEEWRLSEYIHKPAYLRDWKSLYNHHSERHAFCPNVLTQDQTPSILLPNCHHWLF